MLKNNALILSSILLVILISGSVLPAHAAAPTIPVGSSPYNIAIDESTQKIYVANSDDGTISVINAATNTVINTITDGVLPYGVAVDPTTHLIYVANNGGASVTVIDPVNSTQTPISVGNNPTSVAIDPTKNQAYVTNTNDGTVSIINLTTRTVSATITVGASPYGVTIDSATHLVYVSNTNSNSISVIDPTTNTVTPITLPSGSSPYNTVIDHNNNKLYVTDNTSNSVYVIDLTTNSITSTISLPSGSSPYGIDMDTTSHLIYVSNFGTSSLSVINPTSNSIVGVIQVGVAPYSIVVDQITHTIYSVNLADNSVSVIDPSTAQATAIATTIAITSSPSQPVAGQPTILTTMLNPSAAAGTIQFSANGTNIGSPVTITSGVAALITSLAAGSNDIGAVYVPSNTSYTGASNVTTITVKSTSSTGHVNGEGSVTKGSTFEFDIVANDDKKINGHLDYDDKNAKIDLDSKTITSLIIDNTQKSATFTGQAKLNDGKTITYFVVQVTDPDLKGTHDTFSITVYGSTGNVIYQNSGNVQGHVQIQKMTKNNHDDDHDEHHDHNDHNDEHHHTSSQIWSKIHHHKN